MRHLTQVARNAILPIASRLHSRPASSTEDTILIFQPDHLGDILLSQPAVHHLRDRFPNSKLVAVVGPWSHEITTLAWPVDDVVTLAFPGFTRSATASQLAPYHQLRKEARRLAVHRARCTYVLRPDAWWAAWLASLVTPQVITACDQRTRHFATQSIHVPEDEHAAKRALRIAGALLPRPNRQLHLSPHPEARHDAYIMLRRRGIDGPYVVIHPGSGAPVKEWPMHRWKAVGDSMTAIGYQVVLTGSLSEAHACDTIATLIPGSVSIAGQTTVGLLAEILRGAHVVIGPDCGPLHLAVATGTPTVHLFGPSDPRRYGPWGNPSRHHVISAGWACPRCGDLSISRASACGCMLAIQPDDVITAVMSVLVKQEHVE